MEKTKKLAVGILAHVDAGKTTLAEGILYKTGQIRKAGRVDHKDAFLDTEELEKARGITIFSKQAVLKLNETEVTLLDTPGHVDFSAEMERTLQVMDYAVLLISGADGVQGHVETLWRLLARTAFRVTHRRYGNFWKGIRFRYFCLSTRWISQARMRKNCWKNCRAVSQSTA